MPGHLETQSAAARGRAPRNRGTADILRIEVQARGRGVSDAAERAQLARWNAELFAPDRNIIDAFTWQDKRAIGFDIKAYRNDELAGLAHVLVRLVRVDGTAALMGGLGSVMTAPAHQRAGVARATVTTANELILANLHADLGVLLCKPALVPFYRRLGWEQMQGTITLRQPAGEVRWPHAGMVLLPARTGGLPRCLDLCGLPF